MENERGPSWRHAIAVGAILVIFSILLCGCDDEPQPDFSPLAMPEPTPACYFRFDLPNYWRKTPITGTVTITRELRQDGAILATRSMNWQQRIDAEILPPTEFDGSWPVALTSSAAEHWRGEFAVDVLDSFGETAHMSFPAIGHDAGMIEIAPDDTGAYRMVEIEVNSYFLPIIFK